MSTENNKKSGPKTIGFEEALQILNKGGKVLPMSMFQKPAEGADQKTASEFKQPVWVQKQQAGNRPVLATIQNGNIQTFHIGNDQLFDQWVELTDDMIAQ